MFFSTVFDVVFDIGILLFEVYNILYKVNPIVFDNIFKPITVLS